MEPKDTPFTLGDWLVQPRLNLLSRGDDEPVRLEPKMMDVLMFLASRTADVVSREDLIDAVWPDVFVTEAVLTRAIAGLRRALEDDARKPTYIQTIAKRGYRLLPNTAPTSGRPPTSSSVTAPGGPFVVGQWVRGERFYGRASQLSEALEGPRNGIWLVGTRRCGKTSLLKQLEHLATTQPERGLVPVFWDLEGAEDTDGLALDLESSIADAAPVLESAGVAFAGFAGLDVFGMIAALRRQVQAVGRRLLLLCDEAEELLTIADRCSADVRRLRRSLLAHEGMRAVLASGPRLWDLASGADTSPFLDGFLPPLHLGPLDPESARNLVLQTQLDLELRPSLSEDTIDSICETAGDHPYLLQLLGRRAAEGRDLEAVVGGIAADRSVTTLFEVDLALFDDRQQELLRGLSHGQAGSVAEGADRRALLELRQLGIVDDDSHGCPRICNPLFRDWLASL